MRLRIVQPLAPDELAELQHQAAELPPTDPLPRLLATLELERGVARLNARCWSDAEAELRER